MLSFKHINALISPRVAMLMSFAGTSALNYLFGIAIGWLLVPGDYGLVGFGQTIILICSLVLNSGLAWSLSAQLAATDDRSRWERLIRGSIVANLGLSLVLVAAIGLLFHFGILRGGLETWFVAIAVMVTLPFLSIIAIVSGALRGAQSFGNLALVLVVEVLFKTGGGILLVVLGYGAAGALYGFAIGGVLAAIIGLWRVRAVTGMRIRGGLIFLSFRLTGSMFGALIGMALLLNLDILSVKLVATDRREIAGFYQSATMLANIPYYLATAFFNVMFAQIAQEENPSNILSILGSNLSLVLLFFMPIEIGMIIAPEQVLGLVFPAAYLVAAPILRLLAVGNLLLILTGLLSTSFQASKQAIIPAIIFAVAIPLEILALAFIVPVAYLEGASVVFSLTCALTLTAQVFIFHRIMPQIDWLAMLKWFSRYVVCLAVGILAYFTCMYVFDQFLVSASIAGMFYISMLFVLGLQQLPLPVQKALTRAASQG